MKKTVLAIALGLVCAGFAGFSTAAPLAVDGVTAATMNKSCKIKTTTPTATGVTITWSEGYPPSDGSMVVTVTPGVSRPVTYQERSAKSLTVTGLVEGTSYTIQIVCSKSGENPYGASSAFMTPVATTAIQAVANAPAAFSAVLVQGIVRLTVPGKHSADIRVGLYDARGVCLRSMSLDDAGSVAVGELPVSGMASGVYLLRVSGSDISLAQRITINR